MSELRTFEKDGDIFFKNKKGKNIFCKYWNDTYDTNKHPKALIFIVHGIGEHCQRYDKIAEHMIIHLNCFLFSHDHHGHGKSEGKRVHTTAFSDYSDDIVQHVNIIRNKFPEQPLFLLAHSMGGTVAMLTVLNNPDLYTAVAMVAPALKFNPEDAPKWKIFSVKIIAKVLPLMSIGTMDNKNMCHDQAERDSFDKDPLNYHKGLRAGWAIHFYNAMLEINRRAKEIHIPVFTIHGDADNVSPVEGSEELHNKMTNSTFQEIKVIPGAYHEVHREPNGVGKACLDDISEFFSQRLNEIETQHSKLETKEPKKISDSGDNQSNGIDDIIEKKENAVKTIAEEKINL